MIPYPEATDYPAARALRPAGAKGIGAQSFALVRRIREVAAGPASAPVYEVHPEVSFRALKGGAPLEWPKKTSEGREERLELLAAVGIEPVLDAIPGAAVEDVIDACAAAWSAHRIATRRAGVLPAGDPTVWGPRPMGHLVLTRVPEPSAYYE